MKKALFADVLPDGLLLAWGCIDELQLPVFADEWMLIASAVDKRRREFVAGRVLARRLQEQLEIPCVPLVNAEDRAPTWSEGVIGSITHTDTLCGVALGHRHDIGGVGLDFETRGRVSERLWRQLFTDREIQHLRAVADSQRSLAATAVFSAKESFYKFQYPITEKFVGFRDVEVDLEQIDWTRGGRFRVSVLTDLPGIPDSIGGFLEWPDDDSAASLVFVTH